MMFCVLRSSPRFYHKPCSFDHVYSMVILGALGHVKAELTACELG